MLTLIFAPQPPPAQPEFVNMALVLQDLYPALNAAGPSDLIFWTQAELYEFIDEAAQRLARTCGVFVERDTSITTETNTGTYALPADQVATVQCDLGGFVLRPRTVRELEALDALWPATVGEPAAFVQDLMGLGEIVLYPAPDSDYAELAVGLVLRVAPATITLTNAMLGAPTCVREYFTFRALAAARGKQSKAEMPDVAAWMGKLADTLEGVMTEYWGAAQ
jgi:hypothetical protein